ncbi:MAG: B12-binding domain-containing radical SAM protein [Chitinispirillaceae bacterium]|nr:B12-binding domain-containing radical SAM protein [Chitinispirillaceae bacterium]
MARVAFIQSLFFEYPGTESLAAVLKADGHAVAVLIENEPGEKAYRKRLNDFHPDILAFSCTTGLHLWAIGAAAELSQQFPSALRVFGGPHPTFFPEMIEQDPVDIVCRGEGEGALVDLARAVTTGSDVANIPNLWVKKAGNVHANDVRPLIADLDTLPFPDRSVYFDHFRHLRSSRLPFMTGRGCPYHCSYCSNHALQKIYRGKGRYLRRRSPQNVINEIDGVRRTYGLKTVYFQDDTFVVDREWLDRFLMLYRNRIGLPYLCLATADKLTEEAVEALRESGCSRLFFGIETGDEALRDSVLGKEISNDHIRNAAALLKKNRIPFRTYNMVGLPGETLEQALATVALNKAIGTDYPWCSLYFPLPGTELTDSALQRGLINDSDRGKQPFSFFQTSIAASRWRREMINIQRLFIVAVKLHLPMMVLRKCIRLPNNPLYTLLFLAGYAWCYMRSERLNIFSAASIGMRNFKRLFSSAHERSAPGNAHTT